MRDHDADRLRFAKAGAMELGAKATIKYGVSIPTSGRVQEVILDGGGSLELGDLLAKVDDFGEAIHPQFYRVTKVEIEGGGKPYRWLTLETCPTPA